MPASPIRLRLFLFFTVFIASLTVFGLLSDLLYSKSQEPSAVQISLPPSAAERLQLEHSDVTNWFPSEGLQEVLTFRHYRVRQAIHRWMLLLSIFMVFLFTGFCPRLLTEIRARTTQQSTLARWARRVHLPAWVLPQSVYIFLLGLLVWILLLPSSFVSGYLLEKEFGRSTESILSWSQRTALSGLFFLILLTLFGLLFLRIYRRFPRVWFFPTAVATSILSALLFWIAPLMIEPMFHRYSPLPEGPLRDQLQLLIEQEHLPVKAIRVRESSVESNVVNGYVAGFGSSREIVLYDTLLQRLDDREVAAVLAHEIGHWKHHHLVRGFLLLSAACLAVFGLCQILMRRIARTSWIRRSPNPEAMVLPVLGALLLVSYTALLPLGNAISRRFERDADQFALLFLGNESDALESALTKIFQVNRSHPMPNRFDQMYFGTHPAPLNRLREIRSARD